jgi:hypothetical protein
VAVVVFASGLRQVASAWAGVEAFRLAFRCTMAKLIN